jgi:hypothetical protein
MVVKSSTSSNRRSFLQLSGASLTACGLHLALRRPAFAQSEEPEQINADDLTETLIQYARTGALPLWVAGMFINTWRDNMNFGSLPQDLVDYYRRAGGAYRDIPGAEAIWKTIPSNIRMAGPAALRQFHSDRDWSHFIPRSAGGSDSANNGIFENAVINRARGASTMSAEEISLATRVLESVDLRYAVTLAARSVVAGGLAATVVEGVFAVMEHGLKYYDGEINRTELYVQVWERLSAGGLTAIAIVGIVMGLAILFPALLSVLGALAIPLAVVNFILIGYRFYNLAREWIKRVGLEPILDSWNKGKDITADAWEESASIFDDYIRGPTQSARQWIEENLQKVFDSVLDWASEIFPPLMWWER